MNISQTNGSASRWVMPYAGHVFRIVSIQHFRFIQPRTTRGFLFHNTSYLLNMTMTIKPFDDTSTNFSCIEKRLHKSCFNSGMEEVRTYERPGYWRIPGT